MEAEYQREMMNLNLAHAQEMAQAVATQTINGSNVANGSNDNSTDNKSNKSVNGAKANQASNGSISEASTSNNKQMLEQMEAIRKGNNSVLSNSVLAQY